MNFAMWDGLFNFLLLIVWYRIWNRDSRDAHFNPYLAPVDGLTTRLIDFLRPVFVGMAPRFIAALAVPFLLVFRALLAPRTGLWTAVIGFERRANTEEIVPCIVFSFLSFGIFLFRLWGISLIFNHSRHPPYNRAAATLHFLSRPFSDFAVELRPFVLLAFGVGLAACLDLMGHAVPPAAMGPSIPMQILWQTDPHVVVALKLLIAALAGWVQNLLTLQSAMIVLIIGSWVSMFAASPGIGMICREWVDLLIGPLRNHPIRVGMFDLSPIVFFFALGIVHYVLMRLLIASFQALL